MAENLDNAQNPPRGEGKAQACDIAVLNKWYILVYIAAVGPIRLLILISVLGLLARGSDEQTFVVTINESSVQRSVLLIEGNLGGNPTEFECQTSSNSCSKPEPGQYLMVPAGEGEAIYNDCTNIALYKKALGYAAREKVGVYCWIGDTRCYFACPEQVNTAGVPPGIADPIPALLGSVQRSWRETKSETVYSKKYSNCDYGFYVLLPEGVVGHRGKAPSSNHGIMVNLEQLGSDSPVPDSILRYVQVYNRYTDEKSLQEIVQRERKAQVEIHKNISMSDLTRPSLGGLEAMAYRSTFREKNLSLVEMDVVAYRTEGNVLYLLQLVTTPEFLTKDSEVFDKIVSGFRLTKIPSGGCSND